MTKYITVARSWKELNKWQLEEIVNLLLHYDEKSFHRSFNRMILILFQKKKNFWSALKLGWLLSKVPLSGLLEFGSFILEPPKLGSFPEIKGLKKPCDRLADLSIKQFSFMDQFFHQWMNTKSEQALRALVASIYRIGEQFDEQNLIPISKITDQLTHKERQVIGFIYMSCFHHICSLYPSIYPPHKKQSEKKEKTSHTPFSEIIISIVMNEKSQPLGNLHESNATKIYEFMRVFSIIIDKQKKASSKI